jgi:hypothetical protein
MKTILGSELEGSSGINRRKTILESELEGSSGIKMQAGKACDC